MRRGRFNGPLVISIADSWCSVVDEKMALALESQETYKLKLEPSPLRREMCRAAKTPRAATQYTHPIHIHAGSCLGYAISLYHTAGVFRKFTVPFQSNPATVPVSLCSVYHIGNTARLVTKQRALLYHQTKSRAVKDMEHASQTIRFF